MVIDDPFGARVEASLPRLFVGTALPASLWTGATDWLFIYWCHQRWLGKFPKSMEVYRWIFQRMEVKRWIFPSMFDDTGRLEATCWWLQHVAGTHSTWLRWTATRSWGYPVQDWSWADWGARQGARAKNGSSSCFYMGGHIMINCPYVPVAALLMFLYVICFLLLDNCEHIHLILPLILPEISILLLAHLGLVQLRVQHTLCPPAMRIGRSRYQIRYL